MRGFKSFFLAVGVISVCSHPLSAVTPTNLPVSTTTEVSPSYSVTVSSPSVPPTPTASWRVVPNHAFKAGEHLSFVVRWGVITGGRSTLAIPGVEVLADREAYHIVSEARSVGFVNAFYKTQDRNETWLDTQSLLTVRYERHIHEGHYRIEEAIELDQVNHVGRNSSQRLDKGTTSYLETPLPLNVMDVLGSLYYVRTMPLAVGQSYTVDVYDGKKLWPLVVNVEKRETVKVPAGKFECFRVEPLLREPGIFVSKGKKLQVWMTADEPHMPVMMRSEIFIGHVSAELTSYRLEVSTTPAGPPEPLQ